MPDMLEKKTPEHLEIINDIDVEELASSAQFFLGQAIQYQQLMMMYDCAIKEVRTKLEVLNTEMSLRYQRNPIEYINCRIKKPVSIVRKLQRKGLPATVETLESNAINDIAGIRVICAFIDDIYSIANMLIRQDDITLIDQKGLHKEPESKRLPQPSPDCGSACLLLRSDKKYARGSSDPYNRHGFLGQPGTSA